MTRLIFAVGILAASTILTAETGPTSKYSSSLPDAPQSQTSQTDTTTTQTTQTAMMSTTMTAPNMDWKHNQPVFTMPFGASYTLFDVNNTKGAADTSLFGWYIAPTVQATRHIAARFDLQYDYDTHVNLQRVHLLRATAGPEFTFPIPLISKWTSPFFYAEGGATRISYPVNPGNGIVPYIQWEATADGGFGLQVPITRRLGFQLIPGEYSTFQTDNNNWVGNYSAKAGFVLNLYGDR